MGIFGAPSGSWFGLPDFGFTEALGFNKPQQSQIPTFSGGSVSTGPSFNSITPSGFNQLSPQSRSNPIIQSAVDHSGVLGASNGGGGGGGGGNVLGASIQNFKDSDQAYQNKSDQEVLDIMGKQGQLRNDISSGWDNYLGSLNEINNTYLPQQRTSQEDIANSQYSQGVNTVNTQKAKSLRDIAGNIRNAFQAGNIYLGSRGAGDSSAANQYSYALNKEAGRQTGDVNEYVNTNIQNLGFQRDQKIGEIASWFAQAQTQLKQQMAQGGLSKSQDLQNMSKSLLDQAIRAAEQVKTNADNRYNALLGWAASNSQNIGQLQQNIAGIPGALGQFSGMQQGQTGGVPVAFDQNEQNKQQPFQNPSWFL